MVSAAASAALAEPGPLPSTYAYGTNASGERSAEVTLDLLPVRVAALDSPAIGDRYLLETALGYGISDGVQLDGALSWQQSAAAESPSVSLQGLRERIHLRLSSPDQLAVDTGLVLGVSELFDRVETSQVLVVERRLGACVVTANLRTDERVRRGIDVDWLYWPSVGAACRPGDHVSVGLEFWARGYIRGSELTTTAESTDPAVLAFNSRPHGHVGPTLRLAWPGAFSWSVAGYVRLDELGRTARVGDHEGRFWVRTAFSIAL
jgi:hypothetical protein